MVPRRIISRARVATMQTRTLDPDDLERGLEIRNRSLGVLPAEAREAYKASMLKAIEARTMIGAYEGDLLVGRALIWPFQQWWGGRDVAMAGVAGVVVAPEHRGRGVGLALMDAMIARGRELGFVLSALYPATVSLYRQRGYEIAGAQYRFSFEARLLRDLRGGSAAIREAGPGDAEQIIAMTREHYARGGDNGPKEDLLDDLRDELAEPGIFAYLADGGFVQYGWDGSDLTVYRLIAADPDTARALWAVVGSGSSIAKTVHAYLSPDDPVVHLLGDGVMRDVQVYRWMLRCLDAVAAIEGRGFPTGVEADVAVILDDAHVPANGVSGRLQVTGGKGSLVAGSAEPAAVRLSANALAALYAGVPTTALRASGLLSGGSPRDDALLDAVFAGRPAYMLDSF
jgi:predicted acetyltransferase